MTMPCARPTGSPSTRRSGDREAGGTGHPPRRGHGGGGHTGGRGPAPAGRPRVRPVLVLNQAGVVMGAAYRNALASASGQAGTGPVMRFGVSTVRPSENATALAHRMGHAEVTRAVVTVKTAPWSGCSSPRTSLPRPGKDVPVGSGSGGRGAGGNQAAHTPGRVLPGIPRGPVCGVGVSSATERVWPATAIWPTVDGCGEVADITLRQDFR
jgi:hypothetical protein